VRDRRINFIKASGFVNALFANFGGMKILKIGLILFFSPIISLGQIDSVAEIKVDSITNKLGFEVSTSSFAFQQYAPIAYPLITDIFYKFKHNKIFIGTEYFSTPYREILGLQLGYQYYLMDKSKGASYFLETNARYINTFDYLTNGYYDLVIGFGAERKIFNWLNISCFFGIGAEAFNYNYPWYLPMNENPYTDNKEGFNINPTVDLNLKLSVNLIRKHWKIKS
jgi:hypothetical protein